MIGEWDLANVGDSIRALLEGNVNPETTNLFVSYRGKSSWVEFEVDSDKNQKLLITGQQVGVPENSFSAMAIPIGETSTMYSETLTLQEVSLKFIPKPYKPA